MSDSIFAFFIPFPQNGQAPPAELVLLQDQLRDVSLFKNVFFFLLLRWGPWIYFQNIPTVLAFERRSERNTLATAYIGGALMCRSGPGEYLKLLNIYLHQALEKNQQWLTYDQQREAYVQSVLTRLMELEQQAKQQQTRREDASDGGSMKGSFHWDAALGCRKHRPCCFIQCFGFILSAPAKAVWRSIPPISHVCLTRSDWEFIHVLPNMSRSCSGCQFIRKGRSGEEPLRAAAVGGAERPGKPERSSRQSPAGAGNAEGTGERSQCAILYYYSAPASALSHYLH